MLVNAIVVINATVDLVRGGLDHIPPFDGVEVVFNEDRNVAREVDVNLVKIVDVLLVVRNIVDGREAFFV